MEDSWIDRWNHKLQQYRSTLLKPILVLFNRFGCTADFLSNFKIVLGVLFLALWWYGREGVAVGVFLAALLVDLFDGALARFQGTTSDRGKFLDVLGDHILYCFLVSALLTLSVGALTVAYNIFIVAVAYLLATIRKEEYRPSDWLIKVYPKLSYLKSLIVIPFFTFVFTGIDVLEEAVWAANLLATVLSIYYLVYIQWRWRKNRPPAKSL